MVSLLLERGADQEHKTDEMHTALMEASMVRVEKYFAVKTHNIITI